SCDYVGTFGPAFFFAEDRFFRGDFLQPQVQLLQLVAKRSLQLRQRAGFHQSWGGPGMLLDLQRAVYLVETMRDAARVRNLREGDEIGRGIVPPFDQAFGATNGKKEILLSILVARDEAVE